MSLNLHQYGKMTKKFCSQEISQMVHIYNTFNERAIESSCHHHREPFPNPEDLDKTIFEDIMTYRK